MFFDNGFFDYWITNASFSFSITMLCYFGFILHCKRNTRCLISYHANIMKNYFKFIPIYVLSWIPYMVWGIIDVAFGSNGISFWIVVLAVAFLISSGIANAIMWYITNTRYQGSTKFLNNNIKSQYIINKNENRIGINSSKMSTFAETTVETVAPTKPSDYNPASKIGPRSMYNHDDDTPTMMLIDNTVNEYKYDITSSKFSNIKDQNAIGINNSKMNSDTITNSETTTPAKPSDRDPASKIGPRSMYNGNDDSPSIMIIENVN